jgi:hypothetical protein
MVHSGVCLLRQYTAFAGIVHGQKTRNFFDKLVRRGFAVAYPCRHNRGRVYHVRHRPLYQAIEQADSRHRRPLSAARVVENLVLLDALLASGSVVWRPPSARAVRAIRDRMPTGVDPSGRRVLVYVVTGDQMEDFHWFVQQHAALLGALPSWTVQVVFAPHLQCLGKRYLEEFRSEVASLRSELVQHLRWYFKQRRAHVLERAPIDDPEGYDEAQFAFGATRFQVLYRRWLKDGDGIFDPISTGTIADAMERGDGRFEIHVLPFSYRHLSPLVGPAQHASKGAEEGEDGRAPSRPPVGSQILAGSSGGDSRQQAST